ncbi:chromatin modification-related protein EAF1 B-like isoform X2 [Actinidia eriantha]|uniref:chromatin modification-related protein EAF1 B-like isoform X2 n=1 Tax=Actinidia eriantha TaxID=165200 RepID=UPI0025856B79|nr:chromatin modification-related protein EAF1 B-like isoform X2 [Actinidia eriantha]
MHEYNLESAFLVNAEVDSMGGVIDGGVGFGNKTSPRQAAIEKAQADLRQEYDAREERRRELEFLDKGGNLLEFKFGNGTPVSVQSTSLTEQPPEQLVTSEAKGSLALTTSPHGDSVESSGRPGARTVCEPNSADNLLLFDVERKFLEGKRNSVHSNRSNIAPSEQDSQLDIAPSEQDSQLDGNQKAKESGDSAAFGLPKNRAYKRRNRSRPNRDSSRSSSTEIIPSRGVQVSSLSSCHGPKNGKGLVLDTNNQNDRIVSSNSNSKPMCQSSDMSPKALVPDTRSDAELDGAQAVESTTGLTKIGLPEPASDFNTSRSLQDKQHNQHSQVDTRETSAMASGLPESVTGRKQVVSGGLVCPPHASTAKAENNTSSGQLNGFSNAKGDRKSISNECQSSNATFRAKCLDSEFSCTQNNLSLDGNNDSDPCNNFRNIDSNGNTKEQALESEGTLSMEGNEMLKNEKKSLDNHVFSNDEHDSVHQSPQGNASIFGIKEELQRSRCGLQNEVKCLTSSETVELAGNTALKTERKPGDSLTDNLDVPKENDITGRPQGALDSSIHDSSDPRRESAGGRLQSSMDPSILGLSVAALSVRGSTGAREQQSSEIYSKLADKALENSILEEARIIKAKRKRIAELSVGTLPLENRRKSHWDFVLEEMTWLANDFAQERLWKITAASQVCHRIASTARLRFEEQNLRCKQKIVAHTLAKAIMEFWHSSEEKSKKSELQCPGKDFSSAVQGYAVRFLKNNTSLVPLGLAEAPATPDRTSDFGTVEMSWEDHFTEENLFYPVPPVSMETYRKSIESDLAQVEKIGCSIQEEVETSTFDAATGNEYEEDEGETSVHYLPSAFEAGKQLKFSHKKRKILRKSGTARSYDLGTGFPFTHIEDKVGTQQSVLMGKRPANSLNVGLIPTKRMRTASRQRVLSPFGAGTSGGVQGLSKTDASSGDTNSLQDDQSTLHGGSHIPNNLEVESGCDFEKQLPFEPTEVSKPRKKKKPKHLGFTHEQRWLDNSFRNEQRDPSRKRLDNYQLESNGSSGLFSQHIMKKPKMMKQSLDSSFDNLTPISGSIPSPVASQMSNMSNPNKLIKILGGRDRGKKSKSLKMPTGQTWSGSQWSLFEDQALVVLVHDLGPNWELISDAINSTLQFKCIFRKPNDCKERHKILMDGAVGDGADSAEDSGSSQPYPSTLPGIPKGSARQLFQRLQGPREEDMIKSHFEKIIMISQKQHYRRTQNDNQDAKPIQPHNSHILALSQVFPNNLNEGPPLTPFDLCDTTASGPDVLSPGYQGSQAGGLAISNQGTVASVLPASATNSSMHGSSNVALGNNFSSPSSPLNASVRDGRYGVPRSASLSIDGQQRMQQYNHMLSGRNIQQSAPAVSGVPQGTDRGVRILPGGNGGGIVSGLNRTMPMARPRFQGIAPPSMNSGSMITSSMAVMPSPVNVPSGVGFGQGNAMLRPRDTLNMMRPGQNPEHQRQMMVPELQMQAGQGSNQGVHPFGGLSSAFSNQTSPPPVQTHPLHQQQQHQMSPQKSHVLSNSRHPHVQGSNHASSTQHQAYAIRFAKERQLQQRLLQQQHHQQFVASNVLMPHVAPQPQHPISPPLQNNSQIQPQNSSAPVSLPLTQSSSITPMSHHQQKLHMPPHGLSRNPPQAGGLTSQMGKPRQPQQQQQSFQQSGRHHPQHRQQSQSQQQSKLMKGGGRGNMLMHQNLEIDPSLLNGLSATPSSQSAEKTEQAMQFMQGHGLYPGPGLNHVQQSKPSISHSPNQSHPQQKMNSGQANPSSKQVQQMPSISYNSNPGNAAQATSGPLLPPSHQAVQPSVMAAANHQQLQPHQKYVNQTQAPVQRVFQENCQLTSDPQSKSQADQAHTDQQPVSNSPQVSMTTAMPQPSIDSTSGIPVISSSNAQWKTREQVSDSGMANPATQLAPIGSPPLTNSAGSEPMPTVSQGLGHTVGAQWQQQQQSQLQPPSTPSPPLPQQQQLSPQKQLPPPPSQQQTQHLQAANNSLSIRPHQL